MTIDEVRRFQKHEPFRPFEIVLVDGRVFRVRHPDFILAPPKGTWVYVTDDEGQTEHINTVVMSSVRHARGGNGRGRRTA
jgi:hypothetical protein